MTGIAPFRGWEPGMGPRASRTSLVPPRTNAGHGSLWRTETGNHLWPSTKGPAGATRRAFCSGLPEGRSEGSATRPLPWARTRSLRGHRPLQPLSSLSFPGGRCPLPPSLPHGTSAAPFPSGRAEAAAPPRPGLEHPSAWG